MNKTVLCPTCKKEIIWSPEEQWRPFCSERCKLIDLGEWANENHRIVGEKTFTDESDVQNEPS